MALTFAYMLHTEAADPAPLETFERAPGPADVDMDDYDKFFVAKSRRVKLKAHRDYITSFNLTKVAIHV
jgi:hypothetical protein